MIVEPTSLSLEVGATGQITATVTPTQPITFESSNPLIATVNSDGLVEAIAEGITSVSVDTNGGHQVVAIIVVPEA